jgi:ketosteroid isomerase-like protein
MPTTSPATDPLAAVARLQQATNAHDLEAIVACFAEDYVNETPVHPSRSFAGREQVRRNWARILTAVPDLTSTMVASATSDDTVWAEWAWSGTRRDGAPHEMRGVTVTSVRAGVIDRARFFMEPLDRDEAGVDEAVGHAIAAGATA